MKRHFLRAAAAAAACLAIWSAAAPAQAQTHLKWAHLHETSQPLHKWALWASEEIRKRSNGKFDIQVFPAGSLGNEAEINQGLQKGTVDIISSSPSFLARSYPRLGIAYYPFIFRDADHLLAYARSGVFQEMVDELRARTGVQLLAYTYYGVRQTTAQRPFKDCSGMQGLTIRVPDTPVYTAMPRACGAIPTAIAFPQVYQALQSGTVQAQENPLTTIEAKKFYEVQKHIMLTGHIVDGLVTEMAPPLWNALNDGEKRMFTDVAREAAARTTADIKQREAELANEFRKKGLEVHEVDRASIRDAVLKNVPLESLGFDRKDYERIVGLK